MSGTDDNKAGRPLLKKQIEMAHCLRGLFIRITKHGNDPWAKQMSCAPFAISAKKGFLELGIRMPMLEFSFRRRCRASTLGR